MTKKDVKEAFEQFMTLDEDERLFEFEKMTSAIVCIKGIRDDIIKLGQKKFDKEVFSTESGRILATNLVAFGRMVKGLKEKYDEPEEKPTNSKIVIVCSDAKELLKALGGKKKKMKKDK